MRLRALTAFQTAGLFLRLRVKAPPEEGRENAALIDLMARFLRVPKS